LIYTIIGVIILIVALILIAILFIPFHISFYLNKTDKDIQGNFQVRWLKIRLLKRPIPPEEEEKKEEEKKKTRFNIDNIIKLINKFQAAVKHLTPILSAIIKSINLQKFSLHLNLGLYSPVSTAIVSGYFWSISSILNIIPPVKLSLTPDFQKSKIDGSIEFEFKLTLYRIVGAVIKAFTKKPVRELFWCIRKMNEQQN